MVKKLTFTLMCLATGVGMAVAQKTNVSGVVVSADNGEPVIGASVIVKGTTIGTVTDFDGKFNLEVPDGQKTLQISYVGMVQQEVAVRPNVSVRLISDTQNLDEVVVTAQGLTRKEKSLGYSTQQVKADELLQVRQTDLNNALVGKVSGVQFVGSSGATFDEGTIVLRGATSISNDRSDSAPIYVIDGVIADDANGVNMDDVASVNVLKGPAATALYGSRGGNGAIIITTKGGMDGFDRTEINVSHTLTVDVPKIYFDMQDKYGGGYMGADADMKVSNTILLFIRNIYRQWMVFLTMIIITMPAGVRSLTAVNMRLGTHGIRQILVSVKRQSGRVVWICMTCIRMVSAIRPTLLSLVQERITHRVSLSQMFLVRVSSQIVTLLVVTCPLVRSSSRLIA